MSRRLRWLTILVPALAVGIIELLSDSLLDVAFPVPLDTVLIVAAVAALGALFSWLMFRRLDALTTALAAQNEALAARNAAARALHRVSVAITALAELDRILQAVVDNARELLACDVAVLLLSGPDDALAVRASSGSPGAIRPAGDGGPGDGRAAGGGPPEDALRFLDPAGAVARLAAPLQRGGRTIGLLVVGSSSERTFGVDEVETLASLANQAAIAIENARLQDRLRELAVIEERERIAREMHDGLAQVLGYVNTKSQAVDEYLATGRIDEARAQLSELAAAARSVYIDVREAILGLRSPIDPGAGLVAAVEEYARRFADASKLAVGVEATPEARRLDLSVEVEAQVFRIVQESLTNVRKHAGAQRATLTFTVEGGDLVVCVADDGRGFVGAGPSTSDWPRFGLEAMRERAHAVGGSIEWTSSATGAIVRVAVPLAEPGGRPPSVASGAAAIPGVAEGAAT
jgi:signal transduction histidine kinase